MGPYPRSPASACNGGGLFTSIYHFAGPRHCPCSLESCADVDERVCIGDDVEGRYRARTCSIGWLALCSEFEANGVYLRPGLKELVKKAEQESQQQKATAKQERADKVFSHLTHTQSGQSTKYCMRQGIAPFFR